MTTDICVVVACNQCQVHWLLGDPTACGTPGHVHQRFELHRHRTAVALPDGTLVTGVSFDDRDPYGRTQRPDYGLYLDERWRPPWPHDHLSWPDFGVPADVAPVVAALTSVLERARRQEQVEVGCLGGHGRTGTALACLAVLCGSRAEDAVAWVRADYCAKAVETPDQAAFVTHFGNSALGGQ